MVPSAAPTPQSRIGVSSASGRRLNQDSRTARAGHLLITSETSALFHACLFSAGRVTSALCISLREHCPPPWTSSSFRGEGSEIETTPMDIELISQILAGHGGEPHIPARPRPHGGPVAARVVSCGPSQGESQRVPLSRGSNGGRFQSRSSGGTANRTPARLHVD